jgi:hypothetical protein
VACGQQRARTAAARAEFHERFNAGQFHEMYTASAIGDRPPPFPGWSGEEAFIMRAGRQRRDYGKFEKDLGDGPVAENQFSYDGYEIVSQVFNTRYSTYPIAESFQWKSKGDQVRLLSYSLAPNAEIRCEQHPLASPDCHTVQLGPVAATPPLSIPRPHRGQ